MVPVRGSVLYRDPARNGCVPCRSWFVFVGFRDSLRGMYGKCTEGDPCILRNGGPVPYELVTRQRLQINKCDSHQNRRHNPNSTKVFWSLDYLDDSVPQI